MQLLWMRRDSARRNEGASHTIARGALGTSLVIAMQRVQQDAHSDTLDVDALPFGPALHPPGSLRKEFCGKMVVSTIFHAVVSKKHLASHALPFIVRPRALAFSLTHPPPPQLLMCTRTTASGQMHRRPGPADWRCSGGRSCQTRQ